MKNKVFPFLLLLGAATSANAQLVCQKAEIDCGKTVYQRPVTATYELQNNGGTTLEITDVAVDCGCTTSSVSKSKLAPGEKCTVNLTYDALMLGHFTKQAMVTHRGSVGAPVLLTMKGVVYAELKDYSGVYPYAMGDLLCDKDVLEFDDVKKGEHPSQEVVVLNNGPQLMTPNIQHMPSYLSVYALPEHLKPGQSGKMFITLLSENLPDFGLNQTTVYLASNLGDKISPENELPVSVVLLPNLKPFEGKNLKFAPKMTLSTKTLEVGEIKGKTQKKASMKITNTGRLPLEISSVQLYTRGIQLTLDKANLKPGESTKLKITADIDVLRKSRTKPRILMITNAPEQSKVVIPIIVKPEKSSKDSKDVKDPKDSKASKSPIDSVKNFF